VRSIEKQTSNRFKNRSSFSLHTASQYLSRISKGICFVRLNQPEAAVSSLNEALSTAGYSSLRRRSRILTDIATAYVLQGEIEEGCNFAHQALDLTQQTKSAMVLQRIHKFRTYVEPWKEVQAVKDLDQKLLFF
jgi:hypothetical protein